MLAECHQASVRSLVDGLATLLGALTRSTKRGPSMDVEWRIETLRETLEGHGRFKHGALRSIEGRRQRECRAKRFRRQNRT